MTEPIPNIFRLIDELCPNGVEFNELEKIGKVSMCKRIFKNQTTDVGEIPFYKIGTFGNEPNAFISKDLFDEYRSKYSFPKKGDVLLSASGTIGRRVIYDGEPAYFQDSNIIWFDHDKSRVLNKFLYYFYATVKWQTEGGTIQRLYNDNLLKIKIPIPPLRIQEAIVDILDTFTTLEAELEVELEARRKQYEYYRNEMLTFGDEIEHKSLDEVAGYSKTRVEATDLDATNYIGVDNLLPDKRGKTTSDYVPTTGRFTKYADGDILLGNIRPYLRKIWRATNTGGTNGDVLVIRITDDGKQNLYSEFLYHVLASEDFMHYNIKNSKGAKMPRGNKAVVMKYSIPIPPLAEQERIVAMLDKFDALVNDISIGLPAEIKARRQQYEYYRDKLLTFPEKACA